VFVIFSGAYIAADYFTGAGIDSTVIFHLQSGIEGAGLGEYTGIIALSVLLLALAISVPLWMARLIRPPIKSSRSPMLAPIAIALLCLYHPVVLNMATLYDVSLPGFSAFRTPTSLFCILRVWREPTSMNQFSPG
jgi:hypothetical protein